MYVSLIYKLNELKQEIEVNSIMYDYDLKNYKTVIDSDTFYILPNTTQFYVCEDKICIAIDTIYVN